MRLGFQTIIWGPRIEDLDGALEIIAAAGFEGVEFAQRTDMLGLGLNHPIDELHRKLERRKLELIGFAGGSLRERLEFCGRFRPAYLYVEDWEPTVAPAAVAAGFKLALHPHMFKTIHRFDDAEKLLHDHPE